MQTDKPRFWLYPFTLGLGFLCLHQRPAIDSICLPLCGLNLGMQTTGIGLLTRGPGSIPTKVMGNFQPNLLCFVLCYGFHVVRYILSRLPEREKKEEKG